MNDTTMPVAVSVLQDWVCRLPFMQQSVLLSAMRNADGVAKRHPSKMLVRWYRRCVVLSAFDRKALTNPWEAGGGSYTGPIPSDMNLAQVTDHFIDARDEMSLHYFAHFMHAAEIIGYKHPDENIRFFWNTVYLRMVHALHTWPETEEQMDLRLGDTEETWRARSDPSSTCSD